MSRYASDADDMDDAMADFEAAYAQTIEGQMNRLNDAMLDLGTVLMDTLAEDVKRVQRWMRVR